MNFKQCVLFILICTQYLTANEYITLDTVSVTAKNVSSKKSILNKNDIKKGQIYDERDLVRNETGITVTEGGRSGNNGYAIRGVESDRVSVKVDGIESVESFMPRYYYIKGFMNGNRNSTEIENLSSIEFVKGANSLTKGSGAIGGSVSMKTKEISDFINVDRNIGLYSKSAYASKNKEFIQVLGAAFKYKGIEALFQHTYKNGHETKNYYSGKISDIEHCGIGVDGKNNNILYPNLCSFGRILPDNAHFKNRSNLMKVGYRFNDYFINTFYEDLRQDYFTEQKSNSVASLNRRNFKEKIPYKRFGIYYEYTPNSDSFLTYLKAQLSRQEVIQLATSKQYKANTICPPGSPSWMCIPGQHLLNNTLDKYREYKISQNKTQIDIEGISNEFKFKNIGNIFNFGIGYNIGKITNKNQEITYSSTSSDIDKIEKFTYQHPVKSKILYAYLKDDIFINDKFTINYGIRFDKYTYKPSISNLAYENGNGPMDGLKKKNFSALTYQAGIEYEFDNTTIGYSYSTGFKAPKIEEMYFELPGNSSTQYIRNLNLKPEKAQNHEISITTQNDNFAISASAFYSKYKNFIDMDYNIKIKERPSFMYGKTYHLDKVIYQSANIDKAFVKGIELNSKFKGSLINLPDELYTTFKATYANGKKSDGKSLMAIQPFTSIAGIGYDNDKFSMLLTAKYVAEKDAKDAKDIIIPNSSQIDVNKITGKITDKTKQPHLFLSKSYIVFDLTTSYKFNKNFTINAGIFNLFNKKYTTWENLRQLRYNGNQSYIGFDGRGIERYTAPRRNFAISFEARY